MYTSALTLLALAATTCHAQLSSIVTPIAPTTSVVTYKTIRCSTIYASTKAAKVARTTVAITTRYPETIYPIVVVNATSSLLSCYSQYPSSAVVDVAAATTRFPAEVYCTKSVEIIKATYVTTPTSTFTETYLSYPTINPEGLQWAIYPNIEGANTDASYSAFDPAVLKNITPWYISTSDSIGGLAGTATSTSPFVKIYDSSVEFNQSYFAINHRWYLHAPQTGTYSVSIPAANDIALLWTGTAAYDDWTRENAVGTVTSGNATQTTYSFSATAGQYLPMRVVYAQATDVYAFSLTLTAPDGTVLLGSNSAASQSVIQYSCNGFIGPAPPFEDFGDEYIL